MDSTKCCYIRSQGKTWTIAKPHHRHGLEMYLDIRKKNTMHQTDPILICTQQEDGAVFMAHYRKKNPSVYSFQEYSPEAGDNGQEYDIMFCPIMVPLASK
jgi:hypothetical protein